MTILDKWCSCFLHKNKNTTKINKNKNENNNNQTNTLHSELLDKQVDKPNIEFYTIYNSDTSSKYSNYRFAFNPMMYQIFQREKEDI
jgi:hypothetical protein